MRRGLISWSREEVPPSVLDSRVARLQGEMQAADLGAALVYTSFARPSAVAWLTHFVPYWNEALLVIFPTGAPVLLAAFSKRVLEWIRSVSHLGEVRSAPDLSRRGSGAHGGDTGFECFVVYSEGALLRLARASQHQRAANLRVIAVHARSKLRRHQIAGDEAPLGRRVHAAHFPAARAEDLKILRATA